MKRQHELSSAEWQRIASVLSGQLPHLPKPAHFEPCYNATSWDFDDLYRAARQDALQSQSIVSQIVDARGSGQGWPRGQYEAKFWLRARWEGAVSYALEMSGVTNALVTPLTPTKGDSKITRWLLFEMWDDLIVDYWLAENLESYTYFESYGMDVDNYADYKKCLDRLRAGHYIRRLDA